MTTTLRSGYDPKQPADMVSPADYVAGIEWGAPGQRRGRTTERQALKMPLGRISGSSLGFLGDIDRVSDRDVCRSTISGALPSIAG